MDTAEIAARLVAEFLEAKGGELSRMETEDAARWMAKAYIAVYDALQAEIESRQSK